MEILQRPLFAVGGFSVKVWMIGAVILAVLAFKYFNK